MRVVITGAAGHIGAMAAQALSVHNLVLVGRRSRRDRRSTAVDLSRASAALSRFRWTRGWDWLFRGADAVVHLAAVVSPTARWRPLLRDDIEATWHVLEAAAANGVPKVVFGSWTWTVRAEERERGASERVQLIGSDAPPRPLTPYGITKAFGEIAGRAFVDEGRLRAFVAVRIGYTPPDGQFPADPETRRRWVESGDLTDLLRRSVEADLQGFHVVYGVSAVANCPFDLGYTRRLLDWTPSEVGQPRRDGPLETRSGGAV